MLRPKYSKKFKNDIKKFEHQRSIMLALREVIERLLMQELLDKKHRSHFLKGNWIGHQECHIKPDLLLIYRIDENKEYLFLERVGSHSDLFKK